MRICLTFMVRKLTEADWYWAVIDGEELIASGYAGCQADCHDELVSSTGAYLKPMMPCSVPYHQEQRPYRKGHKSQ